MGCSWPRSARWGGHWWTKGCICPRVGPRIRAAVRRRGCPRSGGATGRRRSWPWNCWSGPWGWATSRPDGLPETTPSGCRRPFGRDWRPWGCATCWTFRAALRSGPWSLRGSRPGPLRGLRGSGAPASPGSGTGSVVPWSSAVTSCRMRPGGR